MCLGAQVVNVVTWQPVAAAKMLDLGAQRMLLALQSFFLCFAGCERCQELAHESGDRRLTRRRNDASATIGVYRRVKL